MIRRGRCGAGFTLVELLIAVAIVAILAAIVYPSYQEHLRKAKRAEGKSALLRLLQLQERNYTANGTYVDSTKLAELVGVTGTVRSAENWTDGNYDLTAAAMDANGLTQGVTLTATPRTGVFSNDSPPDPVCGVFTLNSVGAKTFSNPNSKGTKDLCW